VNFWHYFLVSIKIVRYNMNRGTLLATFSWRNILLEFIITNWLWTVTARMKNECLSSGKVYSFAYTLTFAYCRTQWISHSLLLTSYFHLLIIFLRIIFISIEICFTFSLLYFFIIKILLFDLEVEIKTDSEFLFIICNYYQHAILLCFTFLLVLHFYLFYLYRDIPI